MIQKKLRIIFSIQIKKYVDQSKYNYLKLLHSILSIVDYT